MKKTLILTPLKACSYGVCSRRKGYWFTLKLLTGLTGIVLVLASPFLVLERSEGAVLADDVLEKLGSIEVAIANLTTRIDALEKRLAAIEKLLVRAPKTEAKTPAKEAKPKETTPAGPENFVSVGGGFLLGNVSHKASLEHTIFSGEIENQSIKGYKTVIFNIRVFDEKGTILGGSDFYLQDLHMGAKVPFEVTIFGVNAKSIAGYEVKFDRGF